MRLFKSISEWIDAIRVVKKLDNAMRFCPHITPDYEFCKKRKDMLNGVKEHVHKTILFNITTHVGTENVHVAGPKIIDFYTGLVGDYKIDELIRELNQIEVEKFALSKINDDQALSPDEIDDIISFSKEKNIPKYATSDAIAKRFEYYITNWKIDNGVLSPIEADFPLQKGEDCYYSGKIELVKMKSVTTRVNYSGPRLRIPIMKGLSYSVGSYNVGTNTQLVEMSMGGGLINVTNKRIIIKTTEKNHVFNLNTVLDVEPYSDAVIIHKNNAAPIIVKSSEASRLYQHLNGATRLLN